MKKMMGHLIASVTAHSLAFIPPDVQPIRRVPPFLPTGSMQCGCAFKYIVDRDRLGPGPLCRQNRHDPRKHTLNAPSWGQSARKDCSLFSLRAERESRRKAEIKGSESSIAITFVININFEHHAVWVDNPQTRSTVQSVMVSMRSAMGN